MIFYIVGGGPSLQGFDFSRLRGHHVIAINKSILDVPWADYFVTIDHSFFLKTPNIRGYLKKSRARKVFIANLANGSLSETPKGFWCHKTKIIYDLDCVDEVIKSYRKDGIGQSWDDFRNGNNSGYCAMQLATLLGASEIYLLGIDLRVRGMTHYHGGYGQSVGFCQKAFAGYLGDFIEGIKQVMAMGVNVHSCSEISNLNGVIAYKPPHL